MTMGAPAIDLVDPALLREIHVHESGDPASPAIVFIHGGGPSGAMWRDHLERLGSRFHCLAPDLPGFGKSNRLASISLNQSADLIAELIASRAPAGRAHVVGLSYGGSVAFALLDRHPERLDRVIIDGASVLHTRSDPFILAGVTLVSPIASTRLAARVLAFVGLKDLGVALRSMSPGAFRRAWMEGYTAPFSKRELEAPCPTLFVAGEREHARVSNAAFAALMPHATARFVPGLGHAWFIQRRELHIRMVESWLSDETLPGGLVPEPPSAAAVARVRRLLPGPDPMPTIGLLGNHASGEIPASHLNLVECPPIAALSTVTAEGYPQTSVVWCDLDDESVRVNTMRGFAKERNMRRDPHVTLLCYDPREPLRYLEIRGTVVEMTEDGAGRHLEELASKYVGQPVRYFGDVIPVRFAETEIPVLCRVQPTHVVAADATAGGDGR